MNPVSYAVSRIKKKAEELYSPVRQNVQKYITQNINAANQQLARPYQAVGNIIQNRPNAPQIPIVNPLLHKTRDFTLNTAKFLDPRQTPTVLSKQGLNQYGKTLQTGLDATAYAYGAGLVTPAAAVGGGLIGAGLGAALAPKGQKLKAAKAGFTEGVNFTPYMTGYLSKTNPAQNTFINRATANIANPLKQQLVKRSVGLGTNVVEGVGLAALQGKNVMDPTTLAYDVAFGAALPAGGGRARSIGNLYESDLKNVREAIDFLSKQNINNIDLATWSKYANDAEIYKNAFKLIDKSDKHIWKNMDLLEKYKLISTAMQDMYYNDGKKIQLGFVAPKPFIKNGKLRVKMEPVSNNPARQDYMSADNMMQPSQINNSGLRGYLKGLLPQTNNGQQTSQQFSSVASQGKASIPPSSGLGKIGEQGAPKRITDVKEYFNKLYTQAIDRFNPLSRIAKEGGKDAQMRHVLTQHYGAGGTATYHVDFELSPILKDVDLNDFKAYIIAKRDLELAGRDIKGSDAELANKELAKLSAKYGGNTAQLEASAQKLYEYQRNLVKTYLVDSGVISKETYNSMLANNQLYVPFKRVMDEVDDFLGVVPKAKGVGSIGSQNVIQKIKGSKRQIIDPIESIIENTYKIVSLGRRNRVAQQIASLKDTMPDVIKPFTGEVGRKPVISVFENGKVKKYLVPPDVAEAAKGLDEDSLNMIVRIFSLPTQVFRASATMYNPEFQAPNVVRDLQSAFVNAGMNPLNFARGVMHLMKRDDLYQEYLKSGARTSMVALDRPFLKKTAAQVAGKGRTIKNPRQLLDIVQSAAEYSEQPTRIALFESALKKGMKRGLTREQAAAEAANIAQESTVNFSRRGSKTKSVNALIAFLNARAQGVDRLVRTAKSNPVGFAFRMGLISQMPAVLTYLNNRNYESFYDDRVVPEYDKENNYIIMLSDTPIKELGGLQYLKFPKGDVGRFANPTEKFLSYLDGRDANVVESLAKSLLKLSPVESKADLIPTALKPGIEDMANYNFFTKRDIVPNYKLNLPAPAQDTESTQPIYRMAGEELNRSPAKLQNLVEGYGTGIAKIAGAGASMVVPERFKSEKNKEGATINKTPVVRRFAGGERRTKEEQAAIDEKMINSFKYKIQDVKAAMKRDDISYEEGQKKIREYEAEQEKVKKKTLQSGFFGSSSDFKVDKRQEYVTSKDAPKNLQEKIDLAIKGIQVDPKNTITAIFTKERLRKITGDAVILERKNYLNELDDENTRIDHIIPLSMGGTNDPKNLQVLTKEQHADKAKLESKLYRDLKANKINKSQAQSEIAKWNKNNPVVTADMLSKDKQKVATTLAKKTFSNPVGKARLTIKNARSLRSDALKIYDDEKLSFGQKQEEWKKIGTNAADVEFMVIDSMSNAEKAPLVYQILKERRGELTKINKFIDKGILTTELAGKMNELGLVSEQHVKDLKKYISAYQKDKTAKIAKVKTSGYGGRKKKLKMSVLKAAKYKRTVLSVKMSKLVKLKSLKPKKKKDVDKRFA